MRKNILKLTTSTCSFLLLFGNIASFSQTNMSVPAAVKEVYGNTTSLSKVQIDWLQNQLDRSSVQKRNRIAGETLPLLSSIGMISKFAPSPKKDDFNNPESINPLKYNIDFFKAEDQFFRIDGTDYVLFVAGKK